MISRLWRPARKALTLWWLRCSESLCGCATGAFIATSLSGSDGHNSSGYTESSIKRKRLRALVGVSQPFAHHSNSLPRALLTLSVTLAWLQSGIMSSVGLWWVCVLIHKQINQNKVGLAATLSQSQHPWSCQQRFTSMPVESHEVTFFTKMNHELQRGHSSCNVCQHPPLWVCFFLTVILDERRCVPGCLWPRGTGFTAQAASLKPSACVLSIFKLTWVQFTVTNGYKNYSRITLSVTL